MDQQQETHLEDRKPIQVFKSLSKFHNKNLLSSGLYNACSTSDFHIKSLHDIRFSHYKQKSMKMASAC